MIVTYYPEEKSLRTNKTHASNGSGDIVLECESNDDDDLDSIGGALIRCWSIDYEAVLSNEHYHEQLAIALKIIMLEFPLATPTTNCTTQSGSMPAATKSSKRKH